MCGDRDKRAKRSEANWRPNVADQVKRFGVPTLEAPSTVTGRAMLGR